MQNHRLPIIGTLVACLAYSLAAEARVYRCTDATGKVAYSQVPCPNDQHSDQLRLGTKPRQDKDLCRLARDLGMRSFAQLQQGSEPGTLLDEYGGVDYIQPATLSVINFAASLRYNQDITPQRVGSLTFARCREGGFGQLQPGDLPEPAVGDPALDGLASPSEQASPSPDRPASNSGVANPSYRPR